MSKSKKHVFYIRVLCLLLGTPKSKHETLILKTTSGFYCWGGLVIGGKDYASIPKLTTPVAMCFLNPSNWLYSVNRHKCYLALL